MPRFRVVARDASGNSVEQTLEAANQADAHTQVRGRNLMVISIDEEAAARPGRRAPSRQGAIAYRLIGGPPKPRIKSRDLVVFTRQFATMITSGIHIINSLDILTEQATDPGFKLILEHVIEDVRAGGELSGSLEKHPRLFPGIYVNMIRAGEKAGKLDEILLRLAEYQESSEKLKGQIKSAMVYPIASICMVLAITVVLLIYVVPKFKEIFEGLVKGGAKELPLPTKVVMAISEGFQSYLVVVVVIVVGVFIAIRTIRRTEKGAYGWDRMMLGMPVFGSLFQKVALSRFARTFSTLIRSGVSFLEALEIVAATSGNKVLERAVLASREAVAKGEDLAKPLAESPVFPPMVVRMVAIGQETSRLDDMLEKISQFYDEEVSAAVESMTSLIEPFMIGIMGLLVGGIVLAIFLPILTLQGKMAGRK